ncbi:MAG: hypothetical protein IKL07_07715, partial [Clostridium sp.]|nr:hypothetical protein [Clostridium sp.]
MMVFPLSYQQQKLYIYSRVHENDAEYNVNQGIELNMPIDCERLEKTVKRILIEEPILRCKIIEKDYKPVQYISDISEYAIEYKKIADEKAEDEIHILETKLFDVDGGNLFQIHVLQLASGKNIILFRLHHIICDGWSLQLLMKKFVTYYFENVDEAVIVPEYTYYDYAREQVEQKESEVYQKRTAFWDSVMQENESELELPYDFPKPKIFTREGKRILNFISKEESEQLNQYCKQIGITPFSFLLSVYGDLFSRYSRERQICIAVPVANRFKKKVMESVGYFVNTVPVSIDFTERLTVEDRLKVQHKSFTKMIAKSDVDIECTCNVMFVFQSRPDVPQKDYE